MVDTQSTYQLIGFPEALTVPLVLSVLASTLVPYIQGVEIFNTKIPHINSETAIRIMRLGSPILSILLLIGFVPFWSKAQDEAEPVYSIIFNDVTLAGAVRDLDRRAPEVSIRLDKRLSSGKVAVRAFDVSLEGATLEEVLDVFCESAALDQSLMWERRGKLIIIRPK